MAVAVAMMTGFAAAVPSWNGVEQLTLQELVETATVDRKALHHHASALIYAAALSAAEVSRIATFGAVLGQYDSCHDAAVVQALNDTLFSEWSRAEREKWLEMGRRNGDSLGWPPERLADCPSAAGKRRDTCLGPPNRGWRIGVPCADTERWWVDGGARWDARKWPRVKPCQALFHW